MSRRLTQKWASYVPASTAVNCGRCRLLRSWNAIKQLDQKQPPGLPSHEPVTEHGELLPDGEMLSPLPIHYHSQNYFKKANWVFSEVGLSKWNWLRALCSNYLWESLDKRRFQSTRTIASILQLRECVLQSFNKQRLPDRSFKLNIQSAPFPPPHWARTQLNKQNWKCLGSKDNRQL